MMESSNLGNGGTPYELLSSAGITPESTMKEVQNAAYDLMERGQWTREARAAWDELRTVERRLWADLFLYPVTSDEIAAVIEELRSQGESAPEAQPEKIAEEIEYDS